MNQINFHHYGLAVKELNEPIRFHENLGYVCSKPIIDPIQNVELVLCKSDTMPWVELVKPINDASPINGYIKKNKVIIYHVCYELDNLDLKSKLFSKNKILWETSPQSAILFNNRLISFHFIKNIGLVEILQK